MKSLNARFQKELPQDEEFPHPRGAWLARKLQGLLGTDEWTLGEIENWRDSGWAVTSKAKGREIQIAFASNEQHEWMLQIAPQDSHGLIGSMFGAKPKASDEDILEVGTLCHKVLTSDLELTEVLWRWDGFPEPINSTPQPEAPRES